MLTKALAFKLNTATGSTGRHSNNFKFISSSPSILVLLLLLLVLVLVVLLVFHSLAVCNKQLELRTQKAESEGLLLVAVLLQV